MTIPRQKIAPLTDMRVKNIHEVVSYMKIIKMYGWEIMFKDLVEKIRKKETRLIGVYVFVRVFTLSFHLISPIVSLMAMVTVRVQSTIFVYLFISTTKNNYLHDVLHCVLRGFRELQP